MRKRQMIRRGVALLLATGMLAAGSGAPVCAAGPNIDGQQGESIVGPAEVAMSQAQTYFTDVELVNQNGETVRLYTDLLKGKVVVINTIFTTCTGICPVMSRTYARLQDHLGDRAGRDVHLISISVDPENDTPALLKEFAENFSSGPGWTLLTGSTENVEFALQKLGLRVENKEGHKALVLVGNEPTGLWKKAFGLSPAQDIIAIVDSVIRDEEEPAVTATGS